MPGKRGVDQGESEDTEGNMPLRKVDDGIAPETDDAEGNGVRIKIVKDGIATESDDTEGNAMKFRG